MNKERQKYFMQSPAFRTYEDFHISNERGIKSIRMEKSDNSYVQNWLRRHSTKID